MRGVTPAAVHTVVTGKHALPPRVSTGIRPRMRTALLFAVLMASVAVAQPPVGVPAPPLPPPDEETTVAQPVDRSVYRVTVGGEFGPVFGGWGLWRGGGALVPPHPFGNRPQLFPIPTADYAGDVKHNHSLAARVAAGYTFEYIPLTVTGSWETFHRHAETLLLGYNPDVAPLLGGLNEYNERRRQPQQRWEDVGGDLIGPWVDNGDQPAGSHRDFPRLQMRSVPHAEQHRLRSRVSGNVADFTLAYKVWTPREARGVEYRLLGGGRFGGFFADDVAVNATHEQTASNWYSGFGPHGGVRIDYRLSKSEASDPAEFRLWGEVRGGALYGQVTQRFTELDRLVPANPYRELVLRADRTVPFMSSEVGFGVFGARGGWLSVGVRYSHYWGVGNVGASQLDFAAVAGFLSLGVGF